MQRWHNDNRVKLAERGMRFCHFRRQTETDAVTRIAGTLATILLSKPNEDDPSTWTYLVGVSYVNFTDQGSRLLGRKISSGRVLKALATDLAINTKSVRHTYRMTGAELAKLLEIADRVSKSLVSDVELALNKNASNLRLLTALPAAKKTSRTAVPGGKLNQIKVPVTIVE